MAANRRTFLIAAGAGAGLAIGWAVWPRARAANWAAGDGDTAINAFLKIGNDGRVVVAMPQAEMGQGAWSGLAQIAADELGADWNAVGVEPAPVGPEYANHGMLINQSSGMPAALGAALGWGSGKHFTVLSYVCLLAVSGSVRAEEGG